MHTFNIFNYSKVDLLPSSLLLLFSILKFSILSIPFFISLYHLTTTKKKFNEDQSTVCITKINTLSLFYLNYMHKVWLVKDTTDENRLFTIAKYDLLLCNSVNVIIITGASSLTFFLEFNKIALTFCFVNTSTLSNTQK